MQCPSCKVSDPKVYVGLFEVECISPRCAHYVNKSSIKGKDWIKEAIEYCRNRVDVKEHAHRFPGYFHNTDDNTLVCASDYTNFSEVIPSQQFTQIATKLFGRVKSYYSWEDILSIVECYRDNDY